MSNNCEQMFFPLFSYFSQHAYIRFVQSWIIQKVMQEIINNYDFIKWSFRNSFVNETKSHREVWGGEEVASQLDKTSNLQVRFASDSIEYMTLLIADYHGKGAAPVWLMRELRGKGVSSNLIPIHTDADMCVTCASSASLAIENFSFPFLLFPACFNRSEAKEITL